MKRKRLKGEIAMKARPSMRLMAVALLGAVVVLAGCGLTQPSTEIGAVGYKNVGFEKAVHYEGPLAIVMPDGNRLETNAGKLDVTNDATRMFDSQLEARRMDYELTLSIFDRVATLVDSGLKYWMESQQKIGEPAALSDDDRRVFIEELKAAAIQELKRQLAKESGTGG